MQLEGLPIDRSVYNLMVDVFVKMGTCEVSLQAPVSRAVLSSSGDLASCQAVVSAVGLLQGCQGQAPSAAWEAVL